MPMLVSAFKEFLILYFDVNIYWNNLYLHFKNEITIYMITLLNYNSLDGHLTTAPYDGK